VHHVENENILSLASHQSGSFLFETDNSRILYGFLGAKYLSLLNITDFAGIHLWDFISDNLYRIESNDGGTNIKKESQSLNLLMGEKDTCSYSNIHFVLPHYVQHGFRNN
jgi:hypothetical protein